MLFMSVLLTFVFVSSFALFYTLGISIKLTILIGISWGIITPMAIPLFFTINADVSPPRLRATSMGANTFFAFLLGGAWGPVVMGALSDFFGGGSVGLRQAGIGSDVSGKHSALVTAVFDDKIEIVHIYGIPEGMEK